MAGYCGRRGRRWAQPRRREARGGGSWPFEMKQYSQFNISKYGYLFILRDLDQSSSPPSSIHAIPLLRNVGTGRFYTKQTLLLLLHLVGHLWLVVKGSCPLLSAFYIHSRSLVILLTAHCICDCSNSIQSLNLRNAKGKTIVRRLTRFHFR